MTNLLKAKNKFFIFTTFRIVLFLGLCVVFAFICVFGQGLCYRWFGSGNTYVYYNENLAVHFVDVGHGDCTVIQLPDGKVAIIDGGEAEYYYESRVKTYLEKRIFGGRRGFINYAISTHAHSDHLSGLLRVMDDFRIGTFYAPGDWDGSADYDNYVQITEGLILSDSPQDLTRATYKIQFHAVGINETNANEMSPIITVEYADKVFVITGDAGGETEAAFVNTQTAQDIFGGGRADTLTTYLQVGHHGSNGGSFYPFLNFIKPDISIISSGTYSQQLYNLPHPEVVARLENVGSQIEITRDVGHIAVRCDGNKTKTFYAFDNPPDLTYIWVAVFFCMVLLCFINVKNCQAKNL